MTIRTAITTTLAMSALTVASALAQQAAVTMDGRCEKLVIAGQDNTKDCAATLVNTVAGTRTTFDFSTGDGQTLSFSGTGAQHQGTEVTEPLQPISLVVPGQKGKEGIVRNPAPAVGACKFSSPEKGKTQIDCEANSQGKSYIGVFLADAKPASGGTAP